MDKTVQTNVRVAQSDRTLIVTLAQRLRNDPEFREQVKPCSTMAAAARSPTG